MSLGGAIAIPEQNIDITVMKLNDDLDNKGTGKKKHSYTGRDTKIAVSFAIIYLHHLNLANISNILRPEIYIL